MKAKPNIESYNVITPSGKEEVRYVIREVELFIPQVRDGEYFSPDELQTMTANANARNANNFYQRALIHHKPNSPAPSWKKPVQIGYIYNFSMKETNQLLGDDKGKLSLQACPTIVGDVFDVDEYFIKIFEDGQLPNRSVGLQPTQEAPDKPVHYEIDHLAFLTSAESPWVKLPQSNPPTPPAVNNSTDTSALSDPTVIKSASRSMNKILKICNFEFHTEDIIMSKKTKSRMNKKIDEALKKEPTNFEMPDEKPDTKALLIKSIMAKLAEEMSPEEAVTSAVEELGNINLESKTIEAGNPPPAVVKEDIENMEESDMEEKSDLFNLFTNMMEKLDQILEKFPEEDKKEQKEDKKEQKEDKKEQKEDKNFEKEQEKNKKQLVLPLEQFENQLNLVNFESSDEVLIKFDKEKVLNIYKAVLSGSFADTISAFKEIFPTEVTGGFRSVNFENKDPDAELSAEDKAWMTKDEKGITPEQAMQKVFPELDAEARKKEYFSNF